MSFWPSHLVAFQLGFSPFVPGEHAIHHHGALEAVVTHPKDVQRTPRDRLVELLRVQVAAKPLLAAAPE